MSHSLTRDALLEAVSSASGLTGFGPTDFKEGFDVVLRAYANDTQALLGEQLVWDEVMSDLVGRLQVVDHLKRRPEIRDGSAIVVIAHRDPGLRYPNRLDTCGHDKGGMIGPYVGASKPPSALESRVVHFDELANL